MLHRNLANINTILQSFRLLGLWFHDIQQLTLTFYNIDIRNPQWFTKSGELSTPSTGSWSEKRKQLAVSRDRKKNTPPLPNFGLQTQKYNDKKF